MTKNSQALLKFATNRAAIVVVSILIKSGKNIPYVALEVDLITMTNEEVVHYAKRLHAMLEQYKTKEEDT